MHRDNDTNIRCPECGSLNWVTDCLDYGKATEENFGSCCDCPHVWPVDLEELDKQIMDATCPECEARDCDVDDDLDDVRYCSHCHHFWPDKGGEKLPRMDTREIEQRLTLFEGMTAIKLPRSWYRRMLREEIEGCLEAVREQFVAIDSAETDEKRKEFQQNATALLTKVERKIRQLLSQ
jgi:hypothetical protein